ncbi:hypothetical protein GOODEAATRI_013266 [Goodea atripinnis]|uniref:Uncharacterized protein n=1 Tax=Goodea atripinnis TaxID=208336 RepID=A0ABV0MHH1_9TELE
MRRAWTIWCPGPPHVQVPVLSEGVKHSWFLSTETVGPTRCTQPCSFPTTRRYPTHIQPQQVPRPPQDPDLNLPTPAGQIREHNPTPRAIDFTNTSPSSLVYHMACRLKAPLRAPGGGLTAQYVRSSLAETDLFIFRQIHSVKDEDGMGAVAYRVIGIVNEIQLTSQLEQDCVSQSTSILNTDAETPLTSEKDLFLDYNFFTRLLNTFLVRIGFRSPDPDALGPQAANKTQIAATCEITSRLCSVEALPGNLLLQHGARYLQEYYSSWAQQQGGYPSMKGVMFNPSPRIRGNDPTSVTDDSAVKPVHINTSLLSPTTIETLCETTWPPPGAKMRISKANKGAMVVRVIRPHSSPQSASLEEVWAPREQPEEKPRTPERRKAAEAGKNGVEGHSGGPPRCRKNRFRAPDVRTIFSPGEKDPRVKEETGEGHTFEHGGENNWCDVCCNYILQHGLTCAGKKAGDGGPN